MNLYPSLITDALRTVRYPATGQDIVSMGMLADDIRIDGMHESFTIVIDKPTYPIRRSIVKACEAAVKAHASRDAEVEVRTASRQGEAKQEPLLPAVKNIIAVASGKGGVGKSTVAVNLAVSLACMGLRTGLLDCDISGPSVPKLLRLEDARPYSESVGGRDMIVPIERHGLKTLSIGFFVDPSKPTLWRGAMASNALRQMLGEAAWGELDYLVLDTPPGTSDVHLTLVQSIPITGALIVSTPQEVALADARKGINMYRDEKVRVPILGLVENMAWFTPAEHPEERYHIFGNGGAQRLADELGVPLLAQIPLVQSLCDDSDKGTPPALDASDPLGKAFRLLAARVGTAVDRRNAGQEPTRVVSVNS